MADLLSEALQARARIQEIAAEADRQLLELADFAIGKRRSRDPLGSRFLLNLGAELQRLMREVEGWSRKVEGKWKK